jgi:imidazolonepropionase-like amidohydrolase
MASQVAPIVIQGGRLIDGNGGKPVENATLVIEGTASNKWPREKSIFPASRRSLMPGGRTVLPGFIDNHIHYRGFMGEILLAHGVTPGRDFGIGT